MLCGVNPCRSSYSQRGELRPGCSSPDVWCEEKLQHCSFSLTFLPICLPTARLKWIKTSRAKSPAIQGFIIPHTRPMTRGVGQNRLGHYLAQWQRQGARENANFTKMFQARSLLPRWNSGAATWACSRRGPRFSRMKRPTVIPLNGNGEVKIPRYRYNGKRRRMCGMIDPGQRNLKQTSSRFRLDQRDVLTTASPLC